MPVSKNLIDLMTCPWRLQLKGGSHVHQAAGHHEVLVHQPTCIRGHNIWGPEVNSGSEVRKEYMDDVPLVGLFSRHFSS